MRITKPFFFFWEGKWCCAKRKRRKGRVSNAKGENCAQKKQQGIQTTGFGGRVQSNRSEVFRDVTVFLIIMDLVMMMLLVACARA